MTYRLLLLQNHPYYLMQPPTRVNRYRWDGVPVVERATARLPLALRSVF